MSARLRILRAGPLTTIQDEGRPGLLAHGISASGPMDRGAHRNAGLLAGSVDGAGIELTQAGLALEVEDGRVALGWDGGIFAVRVDGEALGWPGYAELGRGQRLEITPGPAGNFGYVRFGGALELAGTLGSRATSTRARLGGLEGRGLMAGDVLTIRGEGGVPGQIGVQPGGDGPIRFIWGIHAEVFSRAVRDRFVDANFEVTSAMDRMGVRLKDADGVFAGESLLSLVSDPVLAGDIQVLGDGTPIVLMRDHQPTGGYPRIGTVITADLDRFAQMRPGRTVAFEPVTVEHAHRLLRSGQT